MPGVADKRGAILEAAIDVFVRDGFEAASVADIAQEAGVAKGTIYLYFESKDHLVEQTFWHCHQMDFDAIQAGLEALPKAMDRLCQRARSAIGWRLAHPREAAIESMYFSSPRFGGRVRYSRQFLHSAAVDHIVEAGIESGEFKELPIPMLGEIFYSVARALLYHFEQFPEQLEDDAFWTRCRAVFTGALGREGEA